MGTLIPSRHRLLQAEVDAASIAVMHVDVSPGNATIARAIRMANVSKTPDEDVALRHMLINWAIGDANRVLPKGVGFNVRTMTFSHRDEVGVVWRHRPSRKHKYVTGK